jgi:catechol 2,3-dioxygenase-like lactoylglutathione lyase family enzyme
MRFEHFALNVPDARVMSLWYVDHIGLEIVRSVEKPPYTKFMADQTGRVCMEIYSSTSVDAPDYSTIPPLNFHVAFVADDANATRVRLESAGATLFKEDILDDGSVLVMMRDPWGIPLQFCQRTKPF